MISKREPKHMGEVMSDIAERYNKLTKTKMSKEEFNPYVLLMVPKKYFGNIKDEVGVKSLEIIKPKQRR